MKLSASAALATKSLRSYLICLDYYEESVSKGHPEDDEYYAYLVRKVQFWERISQLKSEEG